MSYKIQKFNKKKIIHSLREIKNKISLLIIKISKIIVVVILEKIIHKII